MFEKEAEKWTIDYVCKDCSRYKECRSKEQCTCKECSKEKWQKGAEFGYNKANEWHYPSNCSELKKQLTKAKELIKKFSEFVNNEVELDSEHPQEHTDLWNELCEKAEQFLKEVTE